MQHSGHSRLSGPAVAILLIALGTAMGCSFADSSASISKSVSSPFTSSSKSSGGGEEAEYSADVRDATAAHLAARGASEDLRLRVANIAGEHGISNWEASEITYRAVGAGLAKAKYREVEADAFIAAFADTERQNEWMHEGYKKNR